MYILDRAGMHSVSIVVKSIRVLKGKFCFHMFYQTELGLGAIGFFIMVLSTTCSPRANITVLTLNKKKS